MAYSNQTSCTLPPLATALGPTSSPSQSQPLPLPHNYSQQGPYPSPVHPAIPLAPRSTTQPLLPRPTSSSSVPPSDYPLSPHRSRSTYSYLPSPTDRLPTTTPSPSPSPSSGLAHPSPDDILAEKRRRNAGASARFRDRRKQRERESQDRCERLERRIRELEEALMRADATAAAALASVAPCDSNFADALPREGEKEKEPVAAGVRPSRSLAGGVHELESMVNRLKAERERDQRRLKELEKENSCLRSLINSCPSPANTDSILDRASAPSETNSSDIES